MKFSLRDEFLRRGLVFASLSPSEVRTLAERWRATFAPMLSAEHHPFRWHCFSFDLSPSLKGLIALQEYLSQWHAPFYIFDEAMECCVSCPAQNYPDFSAQRQDIYLVHHHMKWSIAFTHEQPHLGPFFAQRSTA